MARDRQYGDTYLDDIQRSIDALAAKRNVIEHLQDQVKICEQLDEQYSHYSSILKIYRDLIDYVSTL